MFQNSICIVQNGLYSYHHRKCRIKKERDELWTIEAHIQIRENRANMVK